MIPFHAGAHVGLSGAFTMLEFDGAILVESALPAAESIDLLRHAAEDMS